MGAMLDLCPAALDGKFSELEQAICLIQRRIGKRQLEDNVEKEKLLSKRDDDREIGLEVSGDMRWDKRGTGSITTPTVAAT